MMSIRTPHRRALRPRLESLEGRVVLSASFDSVVGVTSGAGHGPLPASNAVDASGNMYVAGTFARQTDFDPANERPDGSDILTPRGSTDAFIAKYAPDNSLIWVRRMGGDATNTFDSGSDVAVDSVGNVFVTGSFSQQADFGSVSLTSAGDSDAFVAKLNANGSVLWANRWGATTRDGGSGIAVDSAGNVISVGYTIFVNSSGGQSITGFDVRKFSPTGGAAWSKRIDNSGGTAVSVATDAAGNVFLGGQFYGTADFNPDPRKTNYVTGASAMGVNGGVNSYVLKLTPAGAFGWVAPFVARTSEDSSSRIFLDDLAVDAGGNVVFGGYQMGQVDLNPSSSIDYRLANPRYWNGYVVKLTSGGSLNWASQTGGDFVNSLAVDASGAVYATGYFGAEGFTPGSGLPAVATHGGSDAYVTKFSASGTQDWAVTFGGTGTDVGYAIAVDASGMIYLAGRYQYSVDFDPDPATSRELPDSPSLGMFLLKLRQS